MLRYVTVVRDPLYGYVRLTEVERAIVDTAVFQRLRRIRQLAGSEFVYPAATHTRFEHSLGVLTVATEFAYGCGLVEHADLLQELRLAALLHDVGHGPFSHVFEEVVRERYGVSHEDLTQRVIRESPIADLLNDYGFDAQRIAQLAVGRASHLPQYINDIISGPIDADKLDFVQRDSYHAGVEYGYVDYRRIAWNARPVENMLGFSYDALPALEALVIARIRCFQTIYYHKTSRAVQLMLREALRRFNAHDTLFSPSNIHDFLQLDDYTLWYQLLQHPASRFLMHALLHRRLIKLVCERVLPVDNRLLRDSDSLEALRNAIVAKAGVPSDAVWVDTSSIVALPLRPTGGERVPIVTKDDQVRHLSDCTTIIIPPTVNVLRVYADPHWRDTLCETAPRLIDAWLPELS